MATIAFFTIFGRTDLRKGVSEAKFDAEADFDVKKCLAPPKSAENHEKPKKKNEKFSEKNVKKSKIANLPKRVFPKFRADRSQVRGTNDDPTNDKFTDFPWCPFPYKLLRRIQNRHRHNGISEEMVWA